MDTKNIIAEAAFKLFEELPHAAEILTDVRIDLAIASVEPVLRYHGVPAMTGT